MTFKLSLSFAGLCLAAMDERDPSSPRLHLLAMKCVEANDYHRPVLLYPQWHDVPNKPAGPTTLSCVDLTNSVIEISLGTTPLDLDSLRASYTASLDSMFSTGPLNPSYVINNSNEIASARLTLFTGGAASHGPLTYFKATTPLGWRNQLTTYVEWEIDGVDSQDSLGQECLTLWLQTLDTTATPPVKTRLPLYPTTDGCVRLVLVNAMTSETPPNQPPASKFGDPADHFGAYFKAFPNKPIPPKAQWPVLDDHGPYSTQWPFDKYSGGCGGGPAANAMTKMAAPQPLKPLGLPTVIRPVCFGAIVDVGT